MAAPMASGVRGSVAHSGAASTFFSTCREKQGGGAQGRGWGQPPASASGAPLAHSENGAAERRGAPAAHRPNPPEHGPRGNAPAATPATKPASRRARRTRRKRTRRRRPAAPARPCARPVGRERGGQGRGEQAGNEALHTERAGGRARRRSRHSAQHSIGSRQSAPPCQRASLRARKGAERAWAVREEEAGVREPSTPPFSADAPCIADTPASKSPFVSAVVVFSTLGLSKKAPIAIGVHALHTFASRNRNAPKKIGRESARRAKGVRECAHYHATTTKLSRCRGAPIAAMFYSRYYY